MKKMSMTDKLGLSSETRQLKLGQSFTNPKSTAFHTIRYDFKPASVDTNKMATVDVANNHQVTVTVPHLDGAGVPQTVFKGSQRPYQKECVLVIDRITGQITLEKLSSNVQVKKTRCEPLHKPPRPQTPPIAQRTSSKTRVTSGRSRPDRQTIGLVPKHSPLHASPSYPSPKRSPKGNDAANVMPPLSGQSTLASLPMIGLDELDAPPPVAAVVGPKNGGGASDVGLLSDSSSSSSSDSASSDSEGETEAAASNLARNVAMAAPAEATVSRNGVAKVSNQLLNEDLCLSESGSDSD